MTDMMKVYSRPQIKSQHNTFIFNAFVFSINSITMGINGLEVEIAMQKNIHIYK